MNKKLKKVRINLVLYGSEKVGKKTIIERIKKMNSTETKDIEVTDKIPDNSELEILSKTNRFNNKSINQIKTELEKIINLKKLCAYKKVYSVGNYYVEIKPILGLSHENILENDKNIDREALDEDERKYNIKFELMKNQLEDILNGFWERTNFNYDYNIFVLVFVYDLSRIKTFEIACKYYKKLQNIIERSKNNNFMCNVLFLGNKTDIKKICDINNIDHVSQMLERSFLNNFENNDIIKSKSPFKYQSDKPVNSEFCKNNKKLLIINQNSDEELNDYLNNSSSIQQEQGYDSDDLDKLDIYSNIYTKYFIKVNNISKSRHKSNNILKKQEIFENFEVKNFEISSMPYFSFEKLFDKFLKSLIYPYIDDFSNNYISNSFNNILFGQKTFYKAEKNKLINNNVPGPIYKVNALSITEDDELLKAFNYKKGRFKDKIFVNKTGPKLPSNKFKKKNKQDNDILDINNNLTYSKKDNYDIIKNNEDKIPNLTYKDNNLGKTGISLGVKPAQIKYKQKRRERLNNVLASYKEMFCLDNITNYNNNKELKRPISKSSFTNSNLNKRERMKNYQYIKNKDNHNFFEYDIEGLQENAKIRRQQKEQEKVNKIEDLRKTQEINYQNYIINKERKWALRKEISASKPRIIKEKVYPPLYDTRRDFEFDAFKKFTMGEKLKSDYTYNKYYPQYRLIESDIDYMAKHGNISFSKANRFDNTLERSKYLEKYKNQNKYYYEESKKMEYIKQKKEEDKLRFISDRQAIRNEIERKKQKEKEDRNMKHLEDKLYDYSQIDEDKKHINPGPGAYNINYKQVEESAPSYSLKGKLGYGVFDVKDEYDDPTKMIGFDSNTSTFFSNKLPDFNYLKENNPSFIMPKAPRFMDTTMSNLNSVHTYEKEFNPLQSNYNKKQKLYMGTSERFKNNNRNNSPGPNQYKINGFAETMVKFYKQRELLKFKHKDNKSLNRFAETNYNFKKSNV